jgi:SAM-dependent methyltransferase
MHLAEIRRVLKPTGIAYLATPNKSSPIMEGHIDNNRVLHYRQMGPLFRKHGFEPREYGVRVIQRPDQFHGEVRIGRFLPQAILRPLRPLFPSHMFVMRKSAAT